MPRTFVIADIHGNYQPLLSVFRDSGFDYRNDLLISLGDLVDRGPEPVKVVDELLKIRHLINIKGNHDHWFFEYLSSGISNNVWLFQGGMATLKDYEKHPKAKQRHLEFFASASLYYVDEKNRLFVHAGFDPYRSFHEQKTSPETLLWDRLLFRVASDHHLNKTDFHEFTEIFIGHSPTQLVTSDFPVHFANLWMMDTGAGHRRYLSMMDVDTKEVWQSKCEFIPVRLEV